MPVGALAVLVCFVAWTSAAGQTLGTISPLITTENATIGTVIDNRFFNQPIWGDPDVMSSATYGRISF